MRLLKRLKIEISLDFIMLDPASTLDDLQANVLFFRAEGFYDYLPHDHIYTALVLYEGTPIRRFYEQRFGVTFNPEELPSPFSLFERPEVRRFSDLLREFRAAWQGRIDDVLACALLMRQRGQEDPWHDAIYFVKPDPFPLAMVSVPDGGRVRRIRLSGMVLEGLSWLWDARRKMPEGVLKSDVFLKAVKAGIARAL